MFKSMQNKLRTIGIAPIFFVGSGISRRYIESPNWIGLLKEIVDGRDVNFTKLVQKYTESNGDVNNEKLAEELESIYFDKLNDDEIEEGGSKPYYFRKRIAEITEEYLTKNLEQMNTNSEIIELKKTRPAAIITTNYDRVMETVFEDDYSVLIGQDSLLENVVDGIGEIYKIHGCSSNPNSIVITKKDYDNFFDKSKYLDAKLLTLFLEYPIVFMGYSISDRNIISILSTIVEMLSPEKVEELKSRIWFVERSKNGKDEKASVRINLKDGHYLDIDSFKLQDYGKFYSAIADISIKRIPMKFLKYLKGNVYELVASQEYNPQLLNVNIEDLENIKNFNDVSQFVGLTFSTEKTIGFCNNYNICRAFLEKQKDVKYVAKDLLEYRRNNVVPFYKFLQTYTKEEILGLISDKTSNFYKQIENDDMDYKIIIGKKQDVDYKGELIKQEIEKYASNYVLENKLQYNQENTVIRYVLLQLLNQNIEKVIETDFIVTDYKKELIKVITHLSNEFIREKRDDVFKLVSAIDYYNTVEYNVQTEHNFRFMLCHIDRALYRKEM